MMPGPGPGPPGPPPAGEETTSETGQSALLPRNLFGDEIKPGDTITLKVSAIYGDEVEVAATAEPAEEMEDEDEGEEEASPVMTADQEIEAAAERPSYGNGNATMG